MAQLGSPRTPVGQRLAAVHCHYSGSNILQGRSMPRIGYQACSCCAGEEYRGSGFTIGRLLVCGANPARETLRDKKFNQYNANGEEFGRGIWELLNKAEVWLKPYVTCAAVRVDIVRHLSISARHQYSRDGHSHIVKIEGYNVKIGFVGSGAWNWKIYEEGYEVSSK